MLAYSSIAHAGYLLVAMVAGGTAGGAALLFYLLAYAAMNLGAFGVVIALGAARRAERDRSSDYAGLGFRRPLLGVAMAVFMLSLAGIPPLAGFAGKFYVFSAAVDSGLRRPGGDRRAEQRGERLLLHLDHRHDVHARGGVWIRPRSPRAPT